MDTSNKTIDDYLEDGNKAYAEILKRLAELNLIKYLKQL